MRPAEEIRRADLKVRRSIHYFKDRVRRSIDVGGRRGPIADGYAHGEQRRDFVSVEDVVKVNLFFLDNNHVSGIFNLGTGRSQSFNEVAVATINTLRLAEGKAALDLAGLVSAGIIEYIPFPDALKGKYQSFTQADISLLREAGYTDAFLTAEQGVARYLPWLAGAK